MPSNNIAIIACAGSGKTTRLVKYAGEHPNRRAAIVTYTNNNLRSIEQRFGDGFSGIPAHVDVFTWYVFLLRECVKPYQRAKCGSTRVEGIVFVENRSAKYARESNINQYYFASHELLYSDKVAQFVIECAKSSRGALVARLEHLYTDLFIDEFQDLAGWDLEVVELFLRSKINVTLVGDPRQCIYSTNSSPKNSQFRGVNIVNKLSAWQKVGLCRVEEMSESYRCCQPICDFASQLCPGLPPLKSRNAAVTGHDGVFLVSDRCVADYARRYSPQVLRYNKAAKTWGFTAMNFGASKGLEFGRVLVIPTIGIVKYLMTGQVSQLDEVTAQKLHVAVTRARHSVAILCNHDSPVVTSRWRQ